MQKRSRTLAGIGWGLLLLTLANLAISPAAAEELARIDVLESAEISGAFIFLRDVAQISGAQTELIRNLERIQISKAPQPGEAFFIGGNTVKRRIRQNGYDLSMIRCHTPQKINVRRKSETVGVGAIETAVRDFIRKKLDEQDRPASIRRIEVPNSVVLPTGIVTHKIKLLNGSLLKRKVPVHFHSFVDDQWIGKLLVMVELEMVETVWVARRTLRRGRTILDRDITERTLDISGMPSNIITRPEELLGKKVKREIKAFQVIRHDMVEQPMVVKRGDIVQVIAESDHLRISTMGIIKGIGGRSGDRIQRSLYARVVDAKTVRVEYAK